MSISPEVVSKARGLIRSNEHKGHTAGMALGYVQANLAILPKDYATEFLQFCHFNPKPCPLIGMTEPGDPSVPILGNDIDLRTDVPTYRVWRDGQLVEEVHNIEHLWRDDFVGFVIGCSFSFEEALLKAGIALPHIASGRSVAMYKTNIPCVPAGRFHGPMTVSMRSMKPADAIKAIQICSRFPNVHGAPVHFGNPAAIGIADLNKPDHGDIVDIDDNEVPVFWACGVTPQSVLQACKPSFCITHAPGNMLITDIPNIAMAIF